jgi:hypothetical protein
MSLIALLNRSRETSLGLFKGVPVSDQWIENLVRLVQTKPPSCLSGFRTTPVARAQKYAHLAGWALACSCGSTRGKLLGYPITDFNPTYNGPPMFVSPLAFLCSSCDKTTEIIDTQQHGYDSEISKPYGKSSDTNRRGTGPRQVMQCSKCRRQEFSMTAVCTYSDFDLIEDEPGLEPRVQEYFDSFGCFGTCAECGQESCMAGFELA